MRENYLLDKELKRLRVKDARGKRKKLREVGDKLGARRGVWG